MHPDPDPCLAPPVISGSCACLTLYFTQYRLLYARLVTMFSDPDFSPNANDYNATVTFTKTVHLTATTTLFEATHVAETVPSVTYRPSEPVLDVPHHPKVDTGFTVVFATIGLLLMVGLILRKKCKKLKAFNIPLILGTFCMSVYKNKLMKVNALGHFLHADYKFIKKYELGRVVRIILTLAPIFYSLALFTLHRKTRNRETVRSAMIFSTLAGVHVLYCLIAAFGDGAVLFYTTEKWGEMDVAKHLAVSQVFGQQLMLCVMSGMWLRGRNVTQVANRSLNMEEILALISIPAILAALVIRVSAELIVILRNDQGLMVYEILERSTEIHFTSASALSVTASVCVITQAWLWRKERIACKRRDEQRQIEESHNWTPSPPPEKS